MERDLLSSYPYSEQRITHVGFDYIYVSPHLDDVPLSCAGAICRQQGQGLAILVVTVFAGDPGPPFSPFVESVHRLWHAHQERPYQVRKEEEREAMALLGVDYAWLDWLEILYRDPELSDASDFFCEPGADVVSSRDAELFTKLRAWFADAALAYPGARFVVPLGLGMHRDHQFVFQAARDTLERGRVRYFEDFPYATYYSQDELLEYARSFDLSPIEVDISGCLELRIAACGAYRSQLPTLFYRAFSFEELIRDYTLEAGHRECPVERYWA